MNPLDQVATVAADQLVGLRDQALLLLPRLLTATILALCGLVLGFVARFLARRLVGGLDRLVPGEALKRSLRHVGLQKPARDVLGTLLFWLILLVFLSAALDSLGLPVLSAWLAGVVRYLPSVVAALVILLIGLVAGVFVRDAGVRAADRAGLSYAPLVGRVLQMAVVGTSVLVAVDQAGLNVVLVANLLAVFFGASLFGVTLAFGLGARTTVANILACHYLRKVYHVGQRVRVGQVEGDIDQIMPTAVILSLDGGGRGVIPAKIFQEEVTELVVD